MALIASWKDGFKGISLNTKAIIQANNENISRRAQKREWKRCEKYVREEKPSNQVN